MKTGILTIFNGNYNYGGMLQAYDLAKVCNDMGYTACQVRFSGGTNIIYSSRLQQCKQYSFFEIKGLSDEIIKCFGHSVNCNKYDRNIN